MPNPFLKNLVKDRHALLPRILEFNSLPARYIHKSWLDGWLEPALFSKLSSSRRASRRLSQLIIRKFALGDDWVYDFKEESRRLALVEGATLARLVLLTGLALNAGQIGKIVDKASVLELKSQVGEDGYLFAVKRAPFLLGSHLGRQQGPHTLQSDYREYAERYGMACLKACISGEPPALRHRLRLKFPRAWAHWFDESVPSGKKDSAWFVLKKVLLKEVAPQWIPFFSLKATPYRSPPGPKFSSPTNIRPI